MRLGEVGYVNLRHMFDTDFHTYFYFFHKPLILAPQAGARTCDPMINSPVELNLRMADNK